MRLKSTGSALNLWKWKQDRDKNKKEGAWQQWDKDSISRRADRAAAERNHYITGIDCHANSYGLPTQV